MIIHVRVVPNAKSEGVERISDNEFKVRVREKPVDGRANARVRELLAAEFGVSLGDVVVKTLVGRRKVVEIRNI